MNLICTLETLKELAEKYPNLTINEIIDKIIKGEIKIKNNT